MQVFPFPDVCVHYFGRLCIYTPVNHIPADSGQYNLSCVRSGLLVWTGVDGPDMSDGVEQAAWPTLL